MIKYEIVLVLPGSYDTQAREKLSQKIKNILKDVGAKLVNEKDWGAKKLAYSIKQEKRAHYLLWELKIDKSKIKEFRRLLNFETALLRYILLKVQTKD